jgi:hypothetical protein
MVYIRPIMSFFAVETIRINGTPAVRQVQGKMKPCAITYIRTPQDLD